MIYEKHFVVPHKHIIHILTYSVKIPVDMVVFMCACFMMMYSVFISISILCVYVKVRVWEIPEGGLRRNMTEAVLELYGHSRRVGLIEWHPTSSGILFSAGYDYKVPRQQLLTQQAQINKQYTLSPVI